jgi:hypothetical protein
LRDRCSLSDANQNNVRTQRGAREEKQDQTGLLPPLLRLVACLSD